MISPNTVLTIADTKKDCVYNTHISKIVQEFSSKIIRMNSTTNEDIWTLNLLQESILIKDHKGWTKLNTIIKSKYQNWVKILPSVKQSPELSLSDKSYIPVYDIKDTKIGFHGEVQYHYKLKPVLELTENDIIRVRDYTAEFMSINSIEIYTKDYDGFSIITNSGFYTANEIQIWCNDNYLPEDRNKKLYK